MDLQDFKISLSTTGGAGSSRTAMQRIERGTTLGRIVDAKNIDFQRERAMGHSKFSGLQWDSTSKLDR